MVTSSAPSPPALDDMLSGPEPKYQGAFARPVFLPSLKDAIEWPGGVHKGLDEDHQMASSHHKTISPEFVWRHVDRVQGRYVTQPLPDDLLAALQVVATQTIDPRGSHGRKQSKQNFGDIGELLSFIAEHVVRSDKSISRRNTRFAPDSRRNYSFRLPIQLKQYFEILRPVVVNPYTGRTFENLSQLIVFCLHVFVMAEPWRKVPGSEIWRENRAATKSHPKSPLAAEGEVNGDKNEFSRVDGMAQMQVRIDTGFFDELNHAVALLAPAISRQYKYRLTMSGLWISATTWASRAIDWSAEPLVIRNYPVPSDSLTIEWRQQSPQGLLVGR